MYTKDTFLYDQITHVKYSYAHPRRQKLTILALLPNFLSLGKSKWFSNSVFFIVKNCKKLLYDWHHCYSNELF
jgi:hypothetical protein